MIRVEFPDRRGETVDAAAASALLNGPVNDFFVRNSYGLTSIEATVTPLYRLPQSSTTYRDPTLTEDALAAASADYDVGAFDRVLFLLNHYVPGYLSNGAVANLGSERVWINGHGNFTLSIVAHELGHTYGLFHANLWQVINGGPTSTNGTLLEYGNIFDTMGTGSPPSADFGLFEKERLGWLPDTAITTIARSGTHRIFTFDHPESTTERTLGLRILQDGADWFWIGYRTAHEREPPLLVTGAQVTRGGMWWAGSELLDMTTPGVGLTDSTLQVGRTFKDPVSGVSLRPFARGGAGALRYLDVDVQIPPRSGVLSAWGDIFNPAGDIPVHLSEIQSLAGGYGHVLAIKRDGTVTAWGMNEFGEADVPGDLGSVLAIAAGEQTSGVVRPDGSVIMWGDNRFGATDVPAGLGGVRQLAIGFHWAAALKEDGSIVTWGRTVFSPPDPDPDRPIVSIQASSSGVAVLRSDGSVDSLGTGSIPNDLGDVVQISGGREYFLALRRNGTVAAWGSNNSGQCNVPAGLANVRSVVAGTYTPVAIKDDGSVVAWGGNYTSNHRVPTGLTGVEEVTEAGCMIVRLSTGDLRLASQPDDQTVLAGSSLTLPLHVRGAGPWSFDWTRNGETLAGEHRPVLHRPVVSPEDAGIYVGYGANSTEQVATAPIIVGLSTVEPVIGDGIVLATGIGHPNGNVFDQVLATGTAETITANVVQNRVTRTSFIDLNDDIVQVEFSGPGALTVRFDSLQGPALPNRYGQAQQYVKGHASIIITGADERSHVSVFSVGRATAFDPTGSFDITQPSSAQNDPAKNGSPLFAGRTTDDYDGVADIALIAITSSNGKFGSVRTGNASYFATRGFTGLYAPGVQFEGPVNLGNISAHDRAEAVIVAGEAPHIQITGGDLLQANGHPVQVQGLDRLRFVAGSNSHGVALPAQMNRARLVKNDVDVTTEIVVNP